MVLYCNVSREYGDKWVRDLLRERQVALTRMRLQTKFKMNPSYVLARGDERAAMDKHLDLLVQTVDVIEERLRHAGIDPDGLCQ